MIGLRLLLEAAPKGAKLQATSIVRIQFSYFSKEIKWQNGGTLFRGFETTAV